jgi:hypothetical protein
MKDEQKLNLLQLVIDNARNFDEAKSYASFILGDRDPLTSRTPRADNRYGYTKTVIEDGVYIFSKGYQPVRFEDVWEVDNPKKVNVMVSYHGHEWIVAKNDVSEDKMNLLKNDADIKEKSSFYKSEIEALNDFNMKSCTNHLRKLELSFKLDDGLYIPTVAQLAAMYLYREELNKALRLVCGTPMKEGMYWSSSENNAWFSWGVNYNMGGISYWTHEHGGYVRPCMVHELKKK